MFNSLKIGEKIGAGFAAILLLMIATSVLGLMKINQIMNDLNEIGDERYPKVMLGNEMIKRSLVNGRTIRGAILSSDTAEVEKYIKDIRAFRRENTEALRKIEAMLHTPKG
ncbi:MAG TPA: MCP four helix bundle domain-containing protein, partial [Accumulibacter sp.]|nr:MCP four helix bundle domain-containing protein [Accumulibacter sp.]